MNRIVDEKLLQFINFIIKSIRLFYFILFILFYFIENLNPLLKSLKNHNFHSEIFYKHRLCF